MDKKMKQACKPWSYASIETLTDWLTIVNCRTTSIAEKLIRLIVLSHRSGSSLQRSSFHRSAQKPLTKMISLHQTAEQAKMQSQLVAQFMPLFPLFAHILTFCDKKYRILRFYDNKFCILTSGSLWLSLARCPAHSGSLWLSLALSGSL